MRYVRPEELKVSLLMGSPMEKIKRLYFCVLSYQEGGIHLGDTYRILFRLWSQGGGRSHIEVSLNLCVYNYPRVRTSRVTYARTLN